MLSIPDQNQLIDQLPASHSARSIEERKALLAKARQAALRSHSPYSHFPVGSALLTWSGKNYPGHNTETACGESQNCGEQSAISNAVTNGEHFYRKDFIQMIAVACIKAPSPYAKLLETSEGQARAAAVEGNLLKHLSAGTQPNFASKAQDWLSNKFVLAAIGDGSPCGACRQIINEFSGPDTIVLIDDLRDGILFRMSDLLPLGFKFGPESVQPEQDITDAKAIESSAESGQITLEDAAKLSAGNAYHFSDSYPKSGTALECSDGRIYVGSSVMNSCTGLNIKSMRAAISRAIADGAIERNGTEFIKNMAVSLMRGHAPAAPLHGLDVDLIHEFGDKANGRIIVLRANERILIPMNMGLSF